ncbi:MAG: lantibiotic immunity ABC transporter MutG family permease subunit [Clostridiales bacterium]|nr:lantibiotic immunity ABC transporter MutG family permease subunit [Clostridiales bacterium]
MREQFRYIRSDLYKLRRSPFVLVHLAFAVCGAGIVIIYALLSKSSEVNKLAVFFQMLSIAFPFAIGIVCQIDAEWEARAGNFYNMLTLPNRTKSMISKLLVLLIFGLLSAILSTALFCAFFSLTGAALVLSIEIIILIPAVIWGSSIFIYVFQYMIALSFGGSSCIAVGAVGSLLSALLQTGLGTGIWFIIPYGLGSRFSEFALARVLGLAAFMDLEIKTEIMFCIIETSVILGVMIYLFSKSEFV